MSDAYDALPPRHKAFVDEYRVDGNATQAAIKAGYSRQSAYSQASRLLKRDDICKALADLSSEAKRRAGYSAEDLIVALWREVHGNGPDTSSSARVSAAKALMPTYDLVTENTTNKNDNTSKRASLTDDELAMELVKRGIDPAKAVPSKSAKVVPIKRGA